MGYITFAARNTYNKLENKNDLEIWLCAGISMARRGLIVNAYGLCQMSDGHIVVGDFGFRPPPDVVGENVALYVNKRVCRDIVNSLAELVRMTRKGEAIGIVATILLRDGVADMVAVGSLSGAIPLFKALTFSARHDRRSGVDRRSGSDRRRSSSDPDQK